MTRFTYEGTTFSGQPVSGIARALDSEALCAQLRIEGVLLIEARPVPTGGTWSRLSLRHGYDMAITRFFRHLATLVGAGVPLSKALDGLAQRAQGRAWARTLTDIAERVRTGSSLAQALSASGGIFAGVAIPMIAAAESGGTLAEVLDRIAGFREKWEAVNRKVRGALVYPAVVSIIAVAVVWIMLAHVVPVFAQMFANLGADLPRPTRILLSLSSSARIWWWVIPVLAAAVALGYGAAKRRPGWRLRFAQWGLRLPLLGDILGKVSVARVSRTAATLLENGVPLLPGLRTAAKTAGNVAIECVFLDAADAVESGKPLSEPLAGVRQIPPLASQMLSTGEESANLGRMFGRLADLYEAEADAAVTVITAVIEPALVVVMGIIVAAILIALYLPMFDVLSQIGG